MGSFEVRAIPLGSQKRQIKVLIQFYLLKTLIQVNGKDGSSMKGWLTKRALDGWESAAFSGIFPASAESPS